MIAYLKSDMLVLPKSIDDQPAYRWIEPWPVPAVLAKMPPIFGQLYYCDFTVSTVCLHIKLKQFVKTGMAFQTCTVCVLHNLPTRCP